LGRKIPGIFPKKPQTDEAICFRQKPSQKKPIALKTLHIGVIKLIGLSRPGHPHLGLHHNRETEKKNSLGVARKLLLQSMVGKKGDG